MCVNSAEFSCLRTVAFPGAFSCLHFSLLYFVWALTLWSLRSSDRHALDFHEYSYECRYFGCASSLFNGCCAN